MAVDSLYHATEALILPSPRKQYPSTMIAIHWQLRSMVSCPEPNTIYYPSGTDICRLNTSTCERRIVTKIDFPPRCLVAGNGWICCGGERGSVAIIRVRGSDDTGFESGMGADADARLPLDLDLSRRSHILEDSGIRSLPQSTTDATPVTRTTSVGSELVNCVTLWFPKENTADGTYSTPVAVLANNDKTVAIVDIKDTSVLETLDFPDCVNRAVISPDGQLLITIGDDPFIDLQTRARCVAALPRLSRHRNGQSCFW